MEEAMDRLILSDEQWERVAPHLPGKVSDPGRSAADNRMFLEGVLWIARAGAPWRDLPEAFGNWNSVFQRFRRWALKGVFERLFKVLSDDPDFEYALIDGTIVRVHQPGQRHDSVGVAPLLDGVAIGALIGDKAFDNDWLRRELNERGALAVIPPKA